MSDASKGSALTEYEATTNRLIEAIRAEQQRAAAGETMRDMNAWDAGWADVEEALKSARTARNAYQDELRKKNYDF